MSRDHGNNRFDVFGTELVKLYNDRYRIVVRVDISNYQEDWYESNKANFWKQFGSKYGEPITVDESSTPWEPDDGEEYENMYLVATEMKYLGGGKVDPVLEFVYETLTDEYTQEASDKVDYDLNGLRRVTRTLIAREDSEYTKQVGVNTIQSSQLGRPEITLYLATVGEGQKGADEGGFTRIQETWLESGVLNVAQTFNNGRKRVEVTALNLTSQQVDDALSEVVSGHKLLSQSESNYEGLETTQYAYEIEESFVEDFELNGLRRVSLIELSESDFSAYPYDPASAEEPTTGLYLATQEIDNGGAIKVRTSVWLEAGKLFERESNPSDGLKSITTGWWKVVGTTVGPIIEKSTENIEGFDVLTVTTMNSPDGGDIVDGENDKLVAEYQDIARWTRPGIVALAQEDRSTTTSATSVRAWQRPPCEMKIRVNVAVYYSKSSDLSDNNFDTITGETGVEYWNPHDWATIDGTASDGIEAPDINRTYRGFRAITSDDPFYSNTGSDQLKDSAQAIHGTALLTWVNAQWFGTFIDLQLNAPDGFVAASATIVDGPDRPEGRTWIIDLQNPKAFTDVDGVDYYKKTYVWSYIPDFDRGEDIWDDAP